jgi:NADPH:quinone reductase-like Zn-dependent oxidoreductase
MGAPSPEEHAMQAAIRDRYGSPDVVAIRDVDRPTPAADQVLVRVHTASVNRADLDALGPRWRILRLFMGIRRPRNRRVGIDVTGVVEAVGPRATQFRPGDRVFADLFPFGYGAFAEYACAPERAFLPIPDGLSFEAAATLPHSGVLAVQGLRLRGGRTPKPGDRVLVVGASGNVGPFVVQIAKGMGAEVTGVCRTDKVDFVRSLGADRVIDYTTTDAARTGDRYDWIVDVDAHHGFFHWRGAVKRGGVYVAMGGSMTWILQALFVAPVISLATRRHMGLLLWWKPFRREDVETLERLVADGTIRPPIDRRFPLAEAADALRHVDGGRARGKVLVTMGPSPD